jgi:hypothetical protein
MSLYGTIVSPAEICPWSISPTVTATIITTTNVPDGVMPQNLTHGKPFSLLISSLEPCLLTA